MTENGLKYLLEQAQRHKMTADEKEEQRRSFAYGNAHIENERVTREKIDMQAERLRQKDE